MYAVAHPKFSAALIGTLIKGMSADHSTGASVAVGLRVLISVEYRPGTTGPHRPQSSRCSPQMNLAL
jgi:hypothetical protein